MNVAHVIGVDPGLVHTGAVHLCFKPNLKILEVEHHLVTGLDAQAVADWIQQIPQEHFVYVEKYAPRQSLDSDVRMVQGEQDLRRAIPNAMFLRNMGVKKVVPPELMSVLGVWHFGTQTHHQDLRSAARIAILGMLKEPRLNRIMADVVQAYLDGHAWTVRHV
jgi:hypothetical protein